MRTFEAPIGNDFATVELEEPEADAVKGFVDTHVAGRRGSMISREDVVAERKRDNNEHQHFGVVLDRLEDDQFTLNKKGQPISPKQLVGKAGVRTAAVDACNPGVMIKKPIQNWIQRGEIEGSRGA